VLHLKGLAIPVNRLESTLTVPSISVASKRLTRDSDPATLTGNIGLRKNLEGGIREKNTSKMPSEAQGELAERWFYPIDTLRGSQEIVNIISAFLHTPGDEMKLWAEID
jgi:hypothetical protein